MTLGHPAANRSPLSEGIDSYDEGYNLAQQVGQILAKSLNLLEAFMKTAIIFSAVSLISTTSVIAGGLDRSGQVLGPLWEEGNYAELSFGHVKPDISGTDSPLGPYPCKKPLL